MVRVAEGELINLKGKVLTIDGNTIVILPKHEDLKVQFLLLVFDNIDQGFFLVTDTSFYTGCPV